MQRPALCVVALGLFACSTLSYGEERQNGAPFDVLEYRVLGNSVLPTVAIERAVYPFLGEHKTIADVELARQALENAYHDAGYGTVFVDIPEQQVDSGTVRLRATEGRVDRVHVTGARYFSNGAIREALPALSSGNVPNLPEATAQIDTLNDRRPDRAVTPVLKAGRTPGTVDVELKVADELPFHWSAEVNDRYTADTSRLRASVTASYDNLFQREQSLSLQYQTAPQDTSDVSAIVATYLYRPASMPATTFAFYAVDSDTDVAALGTLSVIGKGRIYGMRAVHALEPGNSYFHNLTLGVDYKDFLENISLEDNQSLVTPISYLLWSAAYGGSKRTDHTATGFSLGANFGMRGLASNSQDFANKRFKGRGSYIYLHASVQELVRLPWTLSLFGRLGGQFTQDPLVSNEQFSIGGAETVRGYLEAAELGDYGANGSIELRTDLPSRWLQKPAGTSYLFAFFDAGVVTPVKPLPSQHTNLNLASYGVGWRLNAWHGLDMALDWAHALDSSGSVEAGDSRLHFLIKYGF